MLPYDPQLVTVTWGPYPIIGFAEDSIVKVEFDEDAITKLIGAKGDAAFTVNSNKGGKATANILQDHPLNAILTAQCAQGRPRGSSLIVLPFVVRDLGGTSLAVGPEACIKKLPDLEYKKGQQMRSWVWEVAAWTKIVIGGKAA